MSGRGVKGPSSIWKNVGNYDPTAPHTSTSIPPFRNQEAPPSVLERPDASSCLFAFLRSSRTNNTLRYSGATKRNFHVNNSPDGLEIGKQFLQKKEERRQDGGRFHISPGHFHITPTRINVNHFVIRREDEGGPHALDDFNSGDKPTHIVLYQIVYLLFHFLSLKLFLKI